jgi:curved DNA-binding protein CbpA
VSNVIEGVDYLVDRYAVLGVPEDADTDTLRRAIREGRAQNHPDRLGRASPEILAVASRARAAIDAAATVLLDPELRAGYDRRLAEFRRDWPDLISSDGRAMVSLSKVRLDLDGLLNGTLKTDADDAAFLAQLGQMTGHNPAQLKRMERLLQADPDDAEVRAMVREARVQHWTYANLLQEMAWARVGVANLRGEAAPVANPFEGAARVQAQIEAFATDVLPQHLGLRQDMVTLRLAPPLQLLGHDSAPEPASAPLPALLDAEVLARAQEAFRARTLGVTEAAEATQAALNAALELTPYVVLHRGPLDGPLDIVLAWGDPAEPATLTPAIPFRLTDTVVKESPLAQCATVADWQAIAPTLTTTCVIVGHHPELQPMLAEVWWMAEQADQLGLVAALPKDPSVA